MPFRHDPCIFYRSPAFDPAVRVALTLLRKWSWISSIETVAIIHKRSGINKLFFIDFAMNFR